MLPLTLQSPLLAVSSTGSLPRNLAATLQDIETKRQLALQQKGNWPRLCPELHFTTNTLHPSLFNDSVTTHWTQVSYTVYSLTLNDLLQIIKAWTHLMMINNQISHRTTTWVHSVNTGSSESSTGGQRFHRRARDPPRVSTSNLFRPVGRTALC